MQKIVYSAKLLTTQSASSIIVDSIPTKTSESFKTVSPTFKLSESHNPQELTNGWDSKQEFTQQNDIVSFLNSTLIQDGRRIVPTLTGPVVIAANEVRVDSGDYELSIGIDPVLGVKSAGLGSMARAFIFNRDNGRVGIEQEFQYTHIDSIREKILGTQFTEIQNNGQDFFVFNMHKPICIASYNGSNIDIDQIDYLQSSFDYNVLINNKGITENNFLAMCDYVSLSSVRITEWDFEEYGMSVGAKYFPIYNHVTIIAKYVDEITLEESVYQIGNSFFGDIDAISGTIHISGEFTSGVSLGRLKGFYLFYGVVPSIFVAPSDPSIMTRDILDDSAELSYIAINDTDDYGNLVITEPIVHISNAEKPTAEATGIIVPLRYDKFFVEPSSNIVIDGTLVKAGHKHWKDNEYNNRIEFSAPVHILDMLEPALLVDGVIETRSPIATSETVSDIAAVYGIFKYDDIIRASLGASVALDTTGVNSLVSNAQGYGEGVYGAGGYGQGKISTHGSTVYYTTGGQQVTPENSRIGLQIKPIDIGYEIILPSWAQESTIQIVEITNNATRPFNDWKFINPDIIILDKEKVDDNTIYSITFEVSVYPIIQNINVSAGTISLAVIADPVAQYPEFLGYYLLHSKEISVRIGYIDDAGVKRYFPKHISINMILEKNYLERVITGTKTLLL